MKRKTEKEKVWESLVEAVAIYLSSVGWQALVIGNPRIQHQPGEDRNFNYEFVVRFTGKQVESPKPAGSTEATPLGRKSK